MNATHAAPGTLTEHAEHAEHTEHATAVVRVSSGIAGLDALIGGGLPRHRTVLVIGDVGTGKTTCGLQFLMEGVRHGEAGVFVSVDEKPQHLIEDARRFGWDVGDAVDRQLITILDASPSFTALRGRNGLDARQVASDLARQIRLVKASRLVIDAVTSLVPDGAPASETEDFMRSLIDSLEDNLQCTTILTARTSGSMHLSPIGRTTERLTSGVIELQIESQTGRGSNLGPAPLATVRSREARDGAKGTGAEPKGRFLVIRKMRGAPMGIGEHAFDIVDGQGIVVR